jgi:hypothetical protein
MNFPLADSAISMLYIMFIFGPLVNTLALLIEGYAAIFIACGVIYGILINRYIHRNLRLWAKLGLGVVPPLTSLAWTCFNYLRDQDTPSAWGIALGAAYLVIPIAVYFGMGLWFENIARERIARKPRKRAY